MSEFNDEEIELKGFPQSTNRLLREIAYQLKRIGDVVEGRRKNENK
ncbi:MAG: hypothetical protein M0R17_05920 [Candidatus Omnitrophica bacterium]|jgi:hypothetical protein|nr:hypothetical protein [Candidatus Omnitrophota bacterium]